jgi:hypothetical protein
MIDAMQHKPAEGVAAEASPFDYLHLGENHV